MATPTDTAAPKTVSIDRLPYTADQLSDDNDTSVQFDASTLSPIAPPGPDGIPMTQTDDSDVVPLPTKAEVDARVNKPYQDTAANITATQTEDVQSALYDVHDVNPDQYANDRKVANKIGASVEDVANDREGAQRQADFSNNEYFERLRMENPVLANTLATDKEMAAVGKDDVENLKKIDGWFKGYAMDGAIKKPDDVEPGLGTALIKAGTKNIVDTSRGMGAFNEYILGGKEITPEVQAQWEKEQAEDIPTDYGVTSTFGGLALASAQQVGPLLYSTAGSMVGGAIGLGVGAPTGPGALATAATGARIGGVLPAISMEGGFALKEFAVMKDADGNYIDPNVAKGAAAIVGLVNGGLEAVGMTQLKATIPGLSDLLKFGSKDAVKKALRDKTVQSAIKNFTKHYAKGITSESLTESAQELVTVLAKIGAAGADGSGGFDTGTLEENAARVGQAGVQAAESMVLLHAPGHVGQLTKDVQAVRQAKTDQQRLTKLADDITAAKTTARAPDKVEWLVQQAKQQGQGKLDNVYIDPKAFATHYQNQGLNPEEVAAELGISEQYKEANETGGPIAMPIELYAGRMVPSQAHTALMNDTKFDPDGYTVNEAKAEQEDWNSRLAEETAKVTADIDRQDGERTESAQIYDDAFQTLTSAAVPEAQARPIATTIAARYAALGSRTGLKPSQLYAESGISGNISRYVPEALSATDDNRLGNLIARAQNSDTYVEPKDEASRVSDNSAVKALKSFARMMGFDVKTTAPEKIIQAVRQQATPQPVGAQLFQFQGTDGAAATALWELGFYSKLTKVAGEKLNKSGTPAQFKQQLEAFAKQGLFKPDELEWSGVLDWLDTRDQNEKLSNADVTEFLNEDGFVLEEVGESQDGEARPETEPLTERDFNEREQEYNEPDDYYIREEARDYYLEDELKAVKEKHEDEPEDEQPSESEMEREAMENAVERAEAAHREDSYNYTTRYSLDRDEVDIPVDIWVDGSGDYFRIKIDGKWVDDEPRDWAQAVRFVDDHLRDDHDIYLGYEADEDGPSFEEYTGRGGENYSFYRLRAPGGLKGGSYSQRGHYSEKDVVIHYRTKDRTGPNGEKMLFIEEVQSDLHQKAYTNRSKLGGTGYNDFTDEQVEAIKSAQEKARRAQVDYHNLYRDIVARAEDEFEDIKGDLTANRFVNVMLDRMMVPDPASDKKAAINVQLEALDFTGVLDEKRARALYEDAPPGTEGWLREALQNYRMDIAEGIVGADPRQKMIDDLEKQAEGVRNVIETLKADRPEMIALREERLENINDTIAYIKGEQIPRFFTRQEVAEDALRIWNRYEDEIAEMFEQKPELDRRTEETNAAAQAVQDAVPFAPFGKTWRQVGLKRLLIKAAQGGYKSIGWTTGTQQNVRYGLSRFINNITAAKDGENYQLYALDSSVRNTIIQASKDRAYIDGETGGLVVPTDVMDEVFGKTNADVIRSQASNNKEDPAAIDLGKGLEVGGERKGGLYDGLLPQEFGNIVKKIDPSMKAELIDYSIKEDDRDIGKIWHAPLTDAGTEKIKEGLELFQQRVDTGPSGSYNQATKAITLFEQADPSTVLHELGHLWLDETRALAERDDVNQEFKDDYEKLKAWLGVTGDMPFTVEQHEKFARSFEAYLYEGRAPSPELQNVFDTFTAWLRQIYKSVQHIAQMAGFQVRINDDVRQIFDRMLATDQEIEDMRSQAEAMEDPAIMEMLSAPEKETYLRRQARARERAKNELLQRAMRDVTKKRKAEWRDNAEEVKSEITERMKMDPLYQTMLALSTGHLIGDPKNEKGIPRVKIDRDWYLEKYGVDAPVDVREEKKRFVVYAGERAQGQYKTREQAEKRAEKVRAKSIKVLSAETPKHIRKMLGKDGVHPDEAAELLAPGVFSSGQEMMEKLRAAEGFDETVAQQTEAEMNARYPDMMDDGSITEEALKAIQNDVRADILEQEHDALAKRANAKRFTKEMARSLAQAAINKRTIRSMNGAYHYFRTGLTLARQVGKALGRLDFEKAAELKKQQLINLYLYRLTKEAEDNIDTKLRYLKKFQKDSTRSRINQEYLDQIDEILEGFDLRAQSSEKTRARREALQDFIKRMADEGTPLDIPAAVVADAYRVSYKDMTLSDFLGMADTVEGIEHLGRLKKFLLKAAEKREFDAVVTEMVDTMEAAQPDLKDVPLAPSLADKFVNGLTKWHVHHWKPEFMFRFLDGYKDLGPVWNALYKPISDAANEEEIMVAEYVEAMRRIFKGYDRGPKRAFLFTEPVYIDAIGQSLTKDQIMSVALNWGNEYNREALMQGYGWSKDQVEEILKTMSDKDWDAVEKSWELIDTLWPRVKQLEERLHGVAPEKVEAETFQNSQGRMMRGGYYPVSFDANRNERAFQRQEKGDQLAVFQDSFTRPMTKKGHTEARTNSGGQPLNLSLDVMSNHIYNVIHDLTHREAAIDVYKLLHDKRVQQMIIKKAGRQAYRQLTPWLQRIVNEKRVMEGPLSDIFGKVRANASIVTMGIKLTTALQQPLGYLNTVERIGAKWAGHGLKSFYGTDRDANPINNMRTQVDTVNSKSAFMAERSKTFDRDVRDALNNMTQHGREIKSWQVSMFYFTQMTQKGVDYPTWLGAYAQGMSDLFDNDEAKAIDYADSVVRQTQSSGAAKDLSAVQAGGNFSRLFTMFYSYFNLLYNVGAERVGMARTGQLTVAKAASSALLLWVLPSLLGSLVSGQAPDDDDPEEWAKWVAKSLFSYPLQTVVGVRDFANALISGYDYRITPVEQAISTIVKGGQAAFGALDEGELSEFQEKNILYGIGYAVGLPTAQVWNMLDYLRDYVDGSEEGFSLYEFLVKKAD